MNIIKRNGQTEKADKSKIKAAIKAAFKDKNYTLTEDLYNELTDAVKLWENISVEEIQDEVIETLRAYGYDDVADEYIIYRYMHKLKREANTTDKTILEVLDGENNYWNKENANKRAYLSTTQHDYLAGISSTDIMRRLILPKELVKLHDEGIIHCHDLDYRIFPFLNCCLINLQDMLDNGTVINGYRIAPQKRFITACTVATQIILGVSSSQYGGCTITTSHLAPYVRKSKEYYQSEFPECWEKLWRKEIKDGVQTINYQVNSMSNSNGQAPFLSIALYINERPEYAEENAIIIEEILKQRIQGMQDETGTWVTPAFPKLLFFLDESTQPGGKYRYLTELAAKCSSKRLVPDYISVKKMKELKEGNVLPCMGCRSFLAPWKNDKGEYQSYGRTNLGVVTLNLVDLALSSNKDWNTFYKLMDERMEAMRQIHLITIHHLENKTSDCAPILWQYGALTRLKSGEKLGPLFKGDRTSCSFGYAGLYECIKYMTGESHSHGIGLEKGLEVMQHFNDNIKEYKSIDGYGYSPYGTPIESTTYKFAKCLKKRFGIIKGITEKDYITNSYHINVTEDIDPFDKLSVESKYQALSLGGAISYIESSDLQKNLEATLEIIDFIYNNIMYAEINCKSDHCLNCGYEGEQLINDNLEWYCPHCGCTDPKKLHHARRVN
jgi:ribonucleoside-triphosphate reductase